MAKNSIVDDSFIPSKNLPIYPENRTSTGYMFVEDDDKPVLCHVQKNVSSIRRLLCEHYMNFKEQNPIHSSKKFDGACEFVKDSYSRGGKYIMGDDNILPKATAITLGGLAGFFFGLKRYGIRRYIYATAGLITTASFCYPRETMSLMRTGVKQLRKQWDDFQKAPEPSK